MTKRDRIVLSVVALVALVGGFFFLAVKPKQAELARLDGEVGQAQARIDGALADLRGAQAAKVAYKRDTRQLALMGKAVPADDDVPSLLYQVHKAARKAGIGFESVTVGEGATPAPAAAAAAAGTTGAAAAPAAETTPGTQPGADGLSTLPLKVKFSGAFFKLDRFLGILHGFANQSGERLDVAGRLLTVESVAIKPAQKGLGLEAEVVANAYVSPAQPAGAAGAAGATGATPAAAGAAAPSTASATTTTTTGASD